MIVEDVTALCNQGVRTDRKVTANRPGIVRKKNKEKTRIPIDVAIPAGRNVTQKKAEKKLVKSVCRDTMDVEQRMYDYTSNNWVHRKSNGRFKE
jgi:hypothetical protein